MGDAKNLLLPTGTLSLPPGPGFLSARCTPDLVLNPPPPLQQLR